MWIERRPRLLLSAGDAAIDRHRLPAANPPQRRAGPSAGTDRQTDGRTDGHRAVSWTLRIIKDKSNVRF